MALPVIINGSECGPSNPLQNFTKVLDQDRGVTRDHYLSQHADLSHGTFRSQQNLSPSIKLEASNFFSSRNVQSEFTSLNPGSFDLASLRGVLPTSPSHNLSIHAPQGQAPAEVSKWALDFMQHQEIKQQPLVSTVGNATFIHAKRAESQSSPLSAQNPFSNFMPQWMPSMPSFRNSLSWTVAPPQGLVQSLDALQASLWDKEFVSHETSLQSMPTHLVSEPVTNDLGKLANSETDELARTAGLLVETVRDEQNPKFKKSDFMNLMRQLRDGELVVEGNEIVERSFDQNNGVDTKGKGKQRQNPDILNRPLQQANSWESQYGRDPLESHSTRKSVHFDASQEQKFENQFISEEEDPNVEYFRQENDDYVNYWTAHARQFQADLETAGPTWGPLQDSWDSFEATASGIREVTHYAFQPHNPYLLGDSLRTQNHMLHTHNSLSLYESVLEFEAAVQRDPLDVNAWFDLGVKQQENEREQKAISALHKAVDLDSSHLAAWLALAISHTNENHRAAADDAIEQWIIRNKKYESIVAGHRMSIQGEGTSVFQSQKHAALIECLMAMARSGEGEIDADVQIALAVLLNSSDEFEKSQDCFRTALAVRPDDWQLYNRVGATMANSGDAAGALHFYYRALELNPAYIRARFNLGISCINLKKYEEAAQHILDALVLQDSDGAVTGPGDKRGITTSALWESLKTTCLHLQRIDLASLCDQQDLDGLRREFHV